jgi:lauroyl/myristoyl acyltransferase
MRDNSPDIVEEVISSPSLYLGDFTGTEKRTSTLSNLGSGRKVKDLLQPVFYWFLKNAPEFLALAPFWLLAGLARLLHRVPGNPLRQSCEDIATIAARHGYEHDPGGIYRQFLRNVVAAGRIYRRLLKEGPEVAATFVDFRDSDQAKSEQQLSEHGGVIVVCPHNFGAVFSGVRLNRTLPIVVVYRNSATIRRTKLALDVIERMKLRIMMVRGGNPFELSRAMFAAIKDHRIVAATVDNVHPGEGGIEARIFGQQVPFAFWAAKIATKKNVPIIPSFYRSVGERVSVIFGEPLVTDNLQEAVQHYVSFFEKEIVEDPASWAYLADRKWRRVLREAATTPIDTAA